MESITFKKKIAAAVRSGDELNEALKADVEIIFLLRSNINELQEQIVRIHEAGKIAFVHIDFAEGVGNDRAGLEYLKKIGADGMCTTRTNLVRMAKDVGLITVQRFFMIDSHSVWTSVDSIRISKPDIVEIMPGVVTKKIREFSALVKVPVITGGLVETEEEVRAALDSGASVVSTGEQKLWKLDL